MSNTALTEKLSSNPLALPALSFRVWLLIAVAAGIGLRLALIVASGWRIDYDEAMVALLGRQVLRGEWVAFTPAQSTLGAIEAYLLAPLYLLLGATPVAVRVLALLLSAVYIVTIGLLGNIAFNRQVGGGAALLAAFAPPYMLIAGMKIWGGTIETIVLGNLLLLATWYTVERAISPQQQRLALVLVGLAAGLMFWVAWLGFYYFVPVVLILLWRGREALRQGWRVGTVAFFIGSAPFWIYNLSGGFPTFTEIFRSPGTSPDMGAISQHMLNDLAPRLVTGDSAWGWSGPRWQILPMIIYYAGSLALLFAPRWWPKAGSITLRWLLALLVVAVPAIYVFSGYGQPALNPWGVDATGRYVLMLHTALPIGVALLTMTFWQMRSPLIRTAGLMLVAVTIGVNLLGALRLDSLHAFDSPYYDRLPDSMAPLIDTLDAQGITHVWTDAGIAHVLMFVSGEQIIAADFYDAYLTEGFVRFPDALAAVEAADRTAFVVPVSSGQESPPIQQALDAADIAYTVVDVSSTLRVYTPSERLDPALIAAGLGYQY